VVVNVLEIKKKKKKKNRKKAVNVNMIIPTTAQQIVMQHGLITTMIVQQ